jgi:hypothetical protein
MASIDSVADDLSSLDGKVNSILEYLKELPDTEKNSNNPLFNYVEDKNNENEREERKLNSLKRKKRVYQAIPIALDSLTPEGSKELTKAIAGIMPSPVSLLPVEKAFKWLPLLLAGLTALGVALFLFKDKIMEFLKNLIPDFIEKLKGDFLQDLIKGLINGITGARVAAAAAEAAGPAVKGAQAVKGIKDVATAAEDVKNSKAIAEAALKEASLARETATRATFGVDESGKIISSRSRDLDKLIRSTLQSIEPAERIKLQSIIKEWNIRTLNMSVEEIQTAIFNLYKSGLKKDDLYAKSLVELLRLKESGLTAQEIRELAKTAKPVVRSFAVETKKTLFGEIVNNLKTKSKELYEALRGAASEAYRSPFTNEEYVKLVKPIEDFTNNIFTSIGNKISAAKDAFMKSALIKNKLDTKTTDAIVSRYNELDETVRTVLKSVNPAERAKLQSIIKEWNTRTLTMSVEELQSVLFDLYNSGIKKDDLYAKSLAELIRLKEAGLTAPEIQELSKTAKPVIHSFAVDTKRTLFEEIVYNLRTVPKEMLQAIKGAVQEAYRSPFTKEEYADLIKPIEDFTNNIFSSIGNRISAVKSAIMESAPVKKALNIGSKITNTLSLLDKRVFTPLFAALGSLEVEQTVYTEIEKDGYNFKTVLDAWVGSVASVFTFGIVSLKDAKEQTDKKLKALENNDYAKAFLISLSVPFDFYGKFIAGLGENISGFFNAKELSKQFAQQRNTIDTAAWYANIFSRVYDFIYNIGGYIIDYGMKQIKPKPILNNNVSATNIPSLDVAVVNDKQYYDKALNAYVEVMEKSNKEMVKTIKEDKTATVKLTESISALSRNIAESSNNVNMINNSRNTTSITISPTTSKSYRDSRTA